MLVSEALAQTPNPQAVIDQTATFYLNQGVLGATCIVFIGLFLGVSWVARGFYKDLKTTWANWQADREKMILAQQATVAATEKSVAALEGLRVALETSKDASEDLTKQVELAAQESRHALSNIKASLDGIAGRMDRGRP
ncbi:hypothetical protein [Methylorubrum thiocyanatum]|uniref:hypothetical protein n=1 Tax=Methylorubrum thiocyanatum TaxID=47958 RepID=UPI0035C7DA3B